MTIAIRLTLAGALVAASCAIAPAQQAQTQRVMGTIEAVNGSTLTVNGLPRSSGPVGMLV